MMDTALVCIIDYVGNTSQVILNVENICSLIYEERLHGELIPCIIDKTTNTAYKCLFDLFPMILITGAGGKTGRSLIKVLSEGEGICAFVHREEQISVAKSLGAEKVVVGDMLDENTIRSAMQGMRVVYHICPNMSPNETVIGKLIIREACQAGIGHFIYHSVLHPQTEKMNHHWQKLRVEEMIFESGLPFTILQPAPYMQNLLASWQTIIEAGLLRVPYSVNSKFSFVDLQDIAEAAKIVLATPGHINAIYELAGTLPVSPVEVADLLGRILNRNVKAEEEPIDEWRLRAEEISEYAIENLVRTFNYYDRCGLTGNPNILKWLLNREPTSLEIFIDGIGKVPNVIH